VKASSSHGETRHLVSTPSSVVGCFPASIIELNGDDRHTHLLVEGHATDELPSTSIFRSLKEASTFFERGSLGYSVTGIPDEFDGLELRSSNWQVQPLAVEKVESSFFENRALFPPGSVELDCALLMRGIDHEWHGRRKLCAKSVQESPNSDTDLEDDIAPPAFLPHAIRFYQTDSPLLSVVVPDGQEATSTGTGAGMNLPQGKFFCFQGEIEFDVVAVTDGLQDAAPGRKPDFFPVLDEALLPEDVSRGRGCVAAKVHFDLWREPA
jgi:hypothetical protein